MAKQRYQVKRKAGSLPKGLPSKKCRLDSGAAYVNPFENARASTTKSPKFLVHNRSSSNQQQKQQHGPVVKSALARAIESRREGLTEALHQENKAGSFIDRRIGEKPFGGIPNKNLMTQEERMLARVVRERVSRSKRSTRYNLDEEEHLLTHKGKALMDSRNGQLSNMVTDDVLLSSDDELGFHGQLDKVDTEMHFGGAAFDSKRRAQMNPYGPANGVDRNLGDVYRSRKLELDDLIAMRKREKLLKSQRKEQQVETFEEMDAHFSELANLLQFRDKELERRKKAEARKIGAIVSSDDQEMDEWDKEMKEYLFERKVKATDRTRTPEEVAKERAEKLHKLEARRLARMSQDFENDNLSDISEQDGSSDHEKRRRRKKRIDGRDEKLMTEGNIVKTSSLKKNPEELDSEDECNPLSEFDVQFSGHDGLVYTDKFGNVIKKTGDTSSPFESEDEDDDDDDEDDDDEDDDDEDDDDKDDDDEDDAKFDHEENYSHSDDEDDDDDDDDDDLENEEEEVDEDSDESSNNSESEVNESETPESGKNNLIETLDLKVGTPVWANYRIDEQFQNRAVWYQGVIRNIHHDHSSGDTLYDIDYDDGDFEEKVRRENIKPLDKTNKAQSLQDKKKTQELSISKRLKAVERARLEIPFTFEIPTTLDALHDLIAKYAQSGQDASVIIQRIFECNSLHLNKANKDKMQNFYDVLIRRFIALGDALYESGDGGNEIGRYDQLDHLTKTLYAMSQEAPDIAGAMWSRRLGIIYNAMVKRLSDSDFVSSDDKVEADTFWPSMGTLLLLRALIQIFPCTDLRHVVMTPALLFIGQCLTHTPVTSRGDLVRGLFLTCLMIECTHEAKRIAPEALAFVSSTLQLFANIYSESSSKVPLPNLTHLSNSSSLVSLVSDLEISCAKVRTVTDLENLQLSLEKDKIDSESSSLSILASVIKLVEKLVSFLNGNLNHAEIETFQQINRSLISLRSSSLNRKAPTILSNYINNIASMVRDMISERKNRFPVMRRTKAKTSQLAIQTLAPRLENLSTFSMSKANGKDREQAEKDRIRREYRREHKAVSRELRLDATFIEGERRKDKEAKDSKARNQRHKNFSWLVQEQASLNQQVAKGGGLLKGGGTGAARAKVATGKIGIKKGGKFR